ncbi:peptidylprolyl isomerase [Rubritalea tangerina]|uniref:Peptidylprolyl isomerase n=2 Tax=Rubritalea tangerina TaxID=430798 RepID=A0ABW4ZDL2_9BACT
MKMSSKFVIRLGVWSVLMLYLFCDLILFEGPLKQQVYRLQGSPAKKLGNDIERGIVARVFTKPILLSQVDYAVDEQLWRSGRTREEISNSQRTALRRIALAELCDHALLREKVALNDKEFPVSEEEINAAMQRFASRFSTPEELQKAMLQFGFEGEKELRFRIAARLQQQKYLNHHIARGIAVTDEEAKAWYKDHQEQLQTPQLYQLRHIFLSKLQHNEDEAVQALREAQEFLQSGTNDFNSLSLKLSEDPRSKDHGGSLGWMSLQRLPADFAQAVEKLKVNQTSLIETTIGWHLVELTDTQASTLRSFDESKAEIVAALETSRRKAAVKEYRKNLRLQHPEKIVIHEALLSADWTE